MTEILLIALFLFFVFCFVVSVVREGRETRRKFKELRDNIGEKQFRKSLRRVLQDIEVDRWMP